ncbi:MAG: phosphatase PAP2 family protein, partial [Actinobacteria bacterium]|nr:phosphatase PAP2 family protein [Actinomycetota bacterium]
GRVAQRRHRQGHIEAAPVPPAPLGVARGQGLAGQDAGQPAPPWRRASDGWPGGCWSAAPPAGLSPRWSSGASAALARPPSLPDAHRRGPDAAGLGYLSGHAAVAVAVALGTAALPRLRGPGRAAVLAAVPVVGLCRIYVGAHLPLDVLGGAALGLAIDGALGVWAGRRR